MGFDFRDVRAVFETRRKELFFAGIAVFALSQVAYREYLQRQHRSAKVDSHNNRLHKSIASKQ
jgi:hypothetical protein